MKEQNTMNTTTTTTANEKKGENTMKEISIFETVRFAGAIEYKPCMRSNERVLVYDIRCALIDGDYKNLLSLVKAWLVMVGKPENPATVDGDVLEIARGLIKIAYKGTGATMKAKEGRRATIDVLNTSRIKAWLYTMKEGRFDMVAAAGERPEEKACKRVPKAKAAITIEGAAYTMDDLKRMLADGSLVVSVK